MARILSSAADYPRVALDALEAMYAKVGKPIFNEAGLMTKGVIVRHLVLPGYVKNSYAALDTLSSYADGRVLFSIMNQFTSLLAPDKLEYFGLEAQVTENDYEALLNYADELGFGEYFWQEGGACEESFIPCFDGTGVKPTT